jgi:hypothetical protein
MWLSYRAHIEHNLNVSLMGGRSYGRSRRRMSLSLRCHRRLRGRLLSKSSHTIQARGFGRPIRPILCRSILFHRLDLVSSASRNSHTIRCRSSGPVYNCRRFVWLLQIDSSRRSMHSIIPTITRHHSSVRAGSLARQLKDHRLLRQLSLPKNSRRYGLRSSARTGSWSRPSRHGKIMSLRSRSTHDTIQHSLVGTTFQFRLWPHSQRPSMPQSSR